jgi:hypothetical protein
MVLRFARIARIRDDKTLADPDTIHLIRPLFQNHKSIVVKEEPSSGTTSQAVDDFGETCGEEQHTRRGREG